MTEPKRTHPFTRGDGTVREYLWITNVACHVCNPYGVDEKRVLGVILDSEGTLITECLNCANEERHRADDFKFKYPPPKDYVPPSPARLPPGVPRRQGEE